MGKLKSFILLFLLSIVVQQTSAQCKINFAGIPCVGNSLTFSNNSTGASSFEWNFNNEGVAILSTSAFVFNTPGIKTIYLRVNFPSSSSCFDTLSFEVFPLPEISSKHTTSDTQCLTGNQFCFIDSSALMGCVSNIRYLFDDGELIVRANPVGAQTFCKSFSGTSDIVSNYTVEVVSCNGCVKTFRPTRNLIIIAPKPISFTSNYPIGCDTVTGHFLNTSQINLSDVEKFIWDFGDGTLDSINWGATGISHFYTTKGPVGDAFTVKLTVWQKGGCKVEFELINAVYNTISPTGIWGIDSFYCDQGALSPEPFGNIPPGMTFTWKMTNSSGTPSVFNEVNPFIRINQLGPHRIVMETNHPTCKKQIFSDTFFVLGPRVRIEEVDSGYLIPQEQRYQCISKDTVFFTNRTRYYLNDFIPINDDSTVLVGGRKRWVFDNNLNPLMPKGWDRKDDKIDRIWDFGDNFAPQCTTNTLLGINVDKNCNFSKDRYPKHFFTPWDTVYKNFYYTPNYSFTYLDFMPNGDCVVRQVDTNEAELHRTLFFRSIPQCYEVSLKEIDTTNSIFCEGEDFINIIVQKPDLTNIAVSGQGCLTDFGTNILLRADFSKTKPKCSVNMLSFNPNVTRDSNNWLPYIGMPPNNSYELIGMFTPFVIYSYDSSVYSSRDDTLTVGFITAVGVAPNICFDTIFIKNPFKVNRAQSFFEIVEPAPSPKKVCIGDTVLFGKNTIPPLFAESAEQIQWSIVRYGADPNIPPTNEGYISEVRKYGIKHPHPDSSHLFVDALVVHDGSTQGTFTIDTLILNEIFDFDILLELTLNGRAILIQEWISMGLPESEYTDEKIAKMFWNGVGTFGNPGTGALGCVDTTGLTQFMQFKVQAKPNGKRILNYRDTSLLPIKVNSVGGKVFNNTYSFTPRRNGMYEVILMVMSSPTCVAISKHRFTVGFSSEIELSDSVLCSDEQLELTPKFRYFKIDGSITDIDSVDYWEIRKDDAGKPGFEGITSIDWSKEDDDTSNINTIFGPSPYGKMGYKSSYVLGGSEANKIYYKEPGKYIMRLATSDSTGCVDTIEKNLYVLSTKAKFSLNIEDLNCRTIIEFFDSSKIVDYYDSSIGSPSHYLYRWRINWGDGSENIFFPNLPPNVGHQYAGFGVFNVQLISTSKGVMNDKDPMCADTFDLELNIPGPRPYFEELSPLVICLGDSVSFVNKSYNPTKYAQFIWNLGDSSFITSQGGDTVVHTYDKPGVYSVFLFQSDSLPGTIHYCSAIYPDTPNQQEIKVYVLDFFNANIEQDKYAICVGDSVKFTVRGLQSALGFDWEVEQDSVKAQTIDSVWTYVFTKPGNFDIVVNPILDSIYLGTQCNLNNRITVYVDSVLADFEVDTTDIPRVCFTNTSINSVNNYWGFYHQTDITETGEPFKLSRQSNDLEFCIDLPDSVGFFWTCLIAESPQNCLDTTCKLIRYYSKRKLYIPNVFTPGGDLLNDFFMIDIEGHDHYELRIYNRWGDIVFESDEHNYQWNGNVNNGNTECPDGTYIYQFRYKFEREEEIDMVSGIITLIREKR